MPTDSAEANTEIIGVVDWTSDERVTTVVTMFTEALGNRHELNIRPWSARPSMTPGDDVNRLACRTPSAG
jgi:hypothetical protein